MNQYHIPAREMYSVDDMLESLRSRERRNKQRKEAHILARQQKREKGRKSGDPSEIEHARRSAYIPIYGLSSADIQRVQMWCKTHGYQWTRGDEVEQSITIHCAAHEVQIIESEIARLCPTAYRIRPSAGEMLSEWSDVERWIEKQLAEPGSR